MGLLTSSFAHFGRSGRLTHAEKLDNFDPFFYHICHVYIFLNHFLTIIAIFFFLFFIFDFFLVTIFYYFSLFLTILVHFRPFLTELLVGGKRDGVAAAAGRVAGGIPFSRS